MDFLASVLAGVSISLGCWIYLLAADKTIGAVLFSCGLLAVRIMKLNLFTGKVQFIPQRKNKWYYYVAVLAGNLIGVVAMALIAPAAVKDAAAPVAEARVALPLIDAFLRGIGCGMLMTIATYPESPLFVSVMCVAAFILAGFNHCIADAFYMIAARNISVQWVAITMGNMCGGAAMGLINISIKAKGGRAS